jgi:hypothetical protein
MQLTVLLCKQQHLLTGLIMATTQHTRCIKWNHVGKRSTNGGLFPWAKREFKKRTNHYQRTTCVELLEWENEMLYEQKWKATWLSEQYTLNNWLCSVFGRMDAIKILEATLKAHIYFSSEYQEWIACWRTKTGLYYGQGGSPTLAMNNLKWRSDYA